ncbi:60s ribosomal protein l26 [Lynx pardinus]|uniref:60s ribosomal protein l26 n=1 Tax=Lynx pardinus TaxID=191816 RepID=A0A485N3G0_LYNPA|nr:60s ribosomal protein l26 [Lynx pardinus]
MKFNSFVTLDHSKNLKRPLNAPLHMHRKILSSPMSKKLQQKYNVPGPCNKDDEGQVVQGHCKGHQTGKLVQVYRKI